MRIAPRITDLRQRVSPVPPRYLVAFRRIARLVHPGRRQGVVGDRDGRTDDGTCVAGPCAGCVAAGVGVHGPGRVDRRSRTDRRAVLHGHVSPNTRWARWRKCCDGRRPSSTSRTANPSEREHHFRVSVGDGAGIARSRRVEWVCRLARRLATGDRDGGASDTLSHVSRHHLQLQRVYRVEFCWRTKPRWREIEHGDADGRTVERGHGRGLDAHDLWDRAGRKRVAGCGRGYDILPQLCAKRASRNAIALNLVPSSSRTCARR